MQTVVETPEFIRCAKKLDLSDDERENIVDLISSNPEAGSEISGTSGMRKVRIAGKGKGKSGGYRVITFFTGSDIPVFLIT
ncbi:MAG: type II toxin-antitoxin system RelE/ParE family toxin, partial [Deltaproteobacteria bacterium]|nr:type II toxin-antitoxin system RelE/ParE family toxin [Deltaproteobacteria bacterium]